MSNEVGELGLTAKQLEVMDNELAETERPEQIKAVMDKFARLSDENEVLSRADQIKSGRAETDDSKKEDE